MRSIIDPSPRTVSVKSLAVLVGMLLCGVGISVREYLASGRPIVRAATSSVVEPGTCQRDSMHCTTGTSARTERMPSASPSPATQPEAPAGPRPSVSAQGNAATQWIPSDESTPDPLEGTRSEPGRGRAGSVSEQ